MQLYEKPGIPVVITGLQDAWQAQQLWNKAELLRRFGNHKFKVAPLTLHCVVVNMRQAMSVGLGQDHRVVCCFCSHKFEAGETNSILRSLALG